MPAANNQSLFAALAPLTSKSARYVIMPILFFLLAVHTETPYTIAVGGGCGREIVAYPAGFLQSPRCRACAGHAPPSAGHPPPRDSAEKPLIWAELTVFATVCRAEHQAANSLLSHSSCFHSADMSDQNSVITAQPETKVPMGPAAPAIRVRLATAAAIRS